MDKSGSGDKWKMPSIVSFFNDSLLDIFNFLTDCESQSCQIGGLLLCVFMHLSFPVDSEYLESGALSWTSLDLQAWLRGWHMEEAQ